MPFDFDRPSFKNRFFSFLKQKVTSPSPDNSLLEADAGPIDYTKHETIKKESVELTVTDSVSGITPPFFFFPLPLSQLCVYVLPVCFWPVLTADESG